MLEDTFESLDDQEELDEAAQEEVDKVLFEITAGECLMMNRWYCFNSRMLYSR